MKNEIHEWEVCVSYFTHMSVIAQTEEEAKEKAYEMAKDIHTTSSLNMGIVDTAYIRSIKK